VPSISNSTAGCEGADVVGCCDVLIGLGFPRTPVRNYLGRFCADAAFTVEGDVEGVKGKAKEVVGKIIGRDDLRREGQAQ
jgi:hypothetical protein